MPHACDEPSILCDTLQKLHSLCCSSAFLCLPCSG
jgi:hypothetical protein